jgi:cytochrome c-type biogenesis protein CcmH
MIRFLLALLLFASTASAWPKEAAPAAADPVLEARLVAITSQLRCLVCQNQTIADSHAALADDLREVVREMLRKGMNDQQIVDYMTTRYGEFILYRPPLQPKTWLLWFGPALLMVGGALTVVVLVRRRARLGDEHFEPEVPAGADAPPAPAAPALDEAATGRAA